MITIGEPVSWLLDYPARGIAKRSLVVHTGHLQNGPGLLPCVGVVRGIFVDEAGQIGVRVAFPYNCGYVSSYPVGSISATFPAEWSQQGEWGQLAAFRQHWLASRRRVGLADPQGVWPEGHVPVPAQFYGW